MVNVKSSKRVTMVTASINKPGTYLDEIIRLGGVWYLKDLQGSLMVFSPHLQIDIEKEYKANVDTRNRPRNKNSWMGNR